MLNTLEDTTIWRFGTYTIAVMLWVILFTVPLVLAYAIVKTLRWAYRIARTERRR